MRINFGQKSESINITLCKVAWRGNLKKWCHIKKSNYALTLYDLKKWCHINKLIYAFTLCNLKKWCHIKKSIYALTLYNPKKWYHIKKSIYALTLYNLKKWCHIKKSIYALTLYDQKKWCHINKLIYALTLYNPKKWCHIKKSIYALTLYNPMKLCQIKKSIHAPSICAQKHLLCTERMASLRKIYCPGGQFICAEQQKPSWSSVSVVMATHYFKSQNAFFLFCTLDRTPFFGTIDGEEWGYGRIFALDCVGLLGWRVNLSESAFKSYFNA